MAKSVRNFEKSMTIEPIPIHKEKETGKYSGFASLRTSLAKGGGDHGTLRRAPLIGWTVLRKWST